MAGHAARPLPKKMRTLVCRVFANDPSVYHVSKQLGLRAKDVRLALEMEQIKIADRKVALADDCATVAEMALEQITDNLENKKYSPNSLVPVFGVAVDKLQTLSGDPSVVIRHEHEVAAVVEHHIKPSMGMADYLKVVQAKVIEPPSKELPDQ